jgi:intracellular septation protein
MAIWNIVLWQFFTEETWANWRLGNVAVGFVFALINIPYTMKHMIDPDEADTSA